MMALFGRFGLTAARRPSRAGRHWGGSARHAGCAPGPNRRLAVLHDDLLSFLEDERHWHVWSPDRIADAALREYAQDVRAAAALGAPGRFLTAGEVAERYYVTHAAVHAWITRGQLPARRWGNYRIDPRDLMRFVPPHARPRTGRPRRPYTNEEDQQLVLLRSTGLTWSAIATVLGRSAGSISGRHRLLARLAAGRKALELV